MIRLYRYEEEAEINAGLGKRGDFAIINVYGHTQVKTIRTPDVVEAFFTHLGEVYDRERRGAEIILIAGDFNAKIGKRQDIDEQNFMGKWGKGERNQNGDMLRSFLEEKGLYLANTHFQHKPMQIATWHGGKPAAPLPEGHPLYALRQRQIASKAPGLHNQIDYIVAPKREMKLITDASAITPTALQYRTDHSLVKIDIQLGSLYRYKMTRAGGFSAGNDMEKLVNDEETRLRYQEMVREKLGLEYTKE